MTVANAWTSKRIDKGIVLVLVLGVTVVFRTTIEDNGASTHSGHTVRTHRHHISSVQVRVMPARDRTCPMQPLA